MKNQEFALHSIIHRYRYARYKSGMTTEEIAKQDKVGLIAVKRSLNLMETQAALYGLDALEVSENEIVIYNKDRQKLALAEALTAEKKVYAQEGPAIGEVIATEPDHDTRLQAVAELTRKVVAVGARHVKGNSTNVNLNQVTAINNATSLMTYEDRLREVKHRRAELNGEVLTIPPESPDANQAQG